MSAEKHTQGRLTVVRHGAIVGGPIREYVNGSGQDQVAMTTGAEWMAEGEKEANARRLVACWNACEGSTTESLELLGSDYIKPLVDLIRQRDELLAALYEATDLMGRADLATISHLPKYRALIAKVKGGAA